jgi:hypothetical protein
MLKRFRIEVEAETAERAVEELWKYEHALQVTEAERYGLGYSDRDFAIDNVILWGNTIAERSYYNERLGRDVAEEVIEYDPKIPGYKARRVVHFKRLDNRFPEQAMGSANSVPGQAPVGLVE